MSNSFQLICTEQLKAGVSGGTKKLAFMALNFCVRYISLKFSIIEK